MRFAPFLWAVVLAAPWRPSPAAAVTGDEIMERVRDRFARARTYEASFEKRFYWAVLDKHATRQGKIYTHRPGRFRVQLEGGDLVVADGEAIWAYSKTNEQVIVSPYDGGCCERRGRSSSSTPTATAPSPCSAPTWRGARSTC